MTKRKLGNSGIEVAPLALGTNVFGWTAGEATSFRLLSKFIDAGFSLVDTADVYSVWAHAGAGGQSEEIIGRWFKQSGRRKDVVLATKVGKDMGGGKKGLKKPYIQTAVEDSLRRLQTDYIDLYQAHDDDAATPLEEALGTFSDLIRQGKVRAIGASNYSADRLAAALRVSQANGLARYETLQPQYNLYDRAVYEAQLRPVCEKEQLGVLPYYTLAAGFLTGKYRSEEDLGGRARAGTVRKYLNDRGLAILGALDQVATQYNSSPAQVALAWSIAQPNVTAPIASATSEQQLESLLQAAELQLDREALDLLDRASEERVATSQ